MTREMLFTLAGVSVLVALVCIFVLSLTAGLIATAVVGGIVGAIFFVAGLDAS